MRNMCDTIFYTKTNVLEDFHICMSVPLILFWVGFSDLILSGRVGENLSPILNSNWEKLEPQNFTIIYTIMYAFRIYTKIFADFSILLMMLSNIDSTTGRNCEIQYLVNF